MSILDDVDFCIELIESDRINVAYIMNLIRSIDLKDLKKRQKQITYIREQLGRTDNPDLYRKVELIKAFLDLLENGLKDEDIDQAYDAFETEERQKDLDAFLTENPEVNRDMLIHYISEYEFSYIIDEGAIRDNITAPLGLLKKKALVKKIVNFIKVFTEKYQ